jgi:SAM-dependent methyltransferase
VSFDVPADAYLRFMGRYSGPLALQLLDLVGVEPGSRVVDVGCGPGVLTAPLVERCGADHVAAVDPSEPFVESVRRTLPGVEVHRATAEELPFADDAFDHALAQLVVSFMADPVAGLREMGRVTRPGGVVATSVWDLAGGSGPLSVIWDAAIELDPSAPHERSRAGGSEGQLASLATAAGLADVRSSSLTVGLPFASFDAWWEPYEDGVGPAGSYVASLGADARAALRERCRARLPEPPFVHEATAWVVLATPPS